jgi:hypothetical protein
MNVALGMSVDLGPVHLPQVEVTLQDILAQLVIIFSLICVDSYCPLGSAKELSCKDGEIQTAT